MGCSKCEIFRMWDVGDLRCSGCGMFGIQDVGCSVCGMFAGMWDVDLQNVKHEQLKTLMRNSGKC